MKMFIKNCFHLQFSTDVEDSHGEMIRVLIQPGETARIDNVDPFYINQDKLFRDEVKFLCAGVQTGEELLVWFECEDTDLVAFNAKICLPGGVAECGQLLVADECGTFRPIGPGADGDVLIWDAAEDLGVKFGAGGGSGLTLSKYKVQQALLGTKDGVNTVFVTPSDFEEETIQVYLDGVRLARGVGCDYAASESGGGGTGWDTVTLAAAKAPIATDNLFADYIEV